MLFRDLPKSQRRALRELAGLAHDRELSAELTKLEAAFARWRAGEIDPHELNDIIHTFHQGPSRKLFSHYTDSDPIVPVAAAVLHGILAEAEVPEQLLSLLTSHIAFFREHARPEADDESDGTS
jgi:hypothetical protein